MTKKITNHPPVGCDLKELHLTWLVTYLAVVRLGNRSMAAKELRISQGAVTKQIQSLEEWSCMALILPNSAPVRLTAQGEAFVQVAEQVLELLTKAVPSRDSLVVHEKRKPVDRIFRVPPIEPKPASGEAINQVPKEP